MRPMDDLLDAVERLLREAGFGNVSRTTAANATTLSAEAVGLRAVMHIEESSPLPAGTGLNSEVPHPETIQMKAGLPNVGRVPPPGMATGSAGPYRPPASETATNQETASQ